MDLYKKLLYYIYLRKPFGKEIHAFFAFLLRYTCLKIYNTVQASLIFYINIYNIRNYSIL